MSGMRKGFVYLAAESYFGIFAQLLGMAIVARLLSPGELGIFQVSAAFAAMASTFRDFGVAEFLIQREKLDEASLRRALGMNIILSWSIGFVLLVASDPLATFYANPQMATILRILAVSFLLIPFGAVTMAWYRRAMDFSPIFWAGILSNITTLVVGCTLAYLGFGALSLAWSSLAGVVVTVLTSFWFRPPNMPRLPLFTGLSEIFHFGKHATGIYLIGQVGKSAPELIIGKLLSMESVAYFSRGGSLLELLHRSVLRAVIPLCLPYFASEVRAGQGVTHAYTRAMAYITGVGWPFLIFVAVAAEEIIGLLYGNQWQAAVRVGQFICVAGMIELVHILSKEALIAVGHVKRSNVLQWVTQVARIAAIGLGCMFGVEAIGFGLIIASGVGCVAAQRELSRCAQVSFSQTVSAVQKSAWLGIATIAVILPLHYALKGTFHIAWILISLSGAFALSWLGAAKVLAHDVWPEVSSAMRYFRRK
jgi:O-antigen/teichoic acid export membrane protein